MSLSNYANLKTSIQNWAKRDDITSLIDDFIDLTEADLAQRLQIRDMESRATADAPTADRFLQLPNNFIRMRKLRLVSGNKQYDLRQQTPESMNVVPSAGLPKNFTVTSQIEFDRTPDSAYTVEMQYYTQVTALSSSNTTNAILSRFPMLYLHGSLYYLFQWAMDVEMATMYKSLYDEGIDAANKVDRRGRHGPAPQMRIEGSTP